LHRQSRAVTLPIRRPQRREELERTESTFDFFRSQVARVS
jgi:hypothetical protein